jgi:HAD superfamily hydrolase (TIGR01450 family)
VVLESTSGALAEEHDVVMLDLDGVVYVGRAGVPGAAAYLGGARERGARLAFVTNNASRPPSAVAEHLAEVGVPAEESDVVTSAQAAARVLRERYGAGARVLALGAQGLLEALAAEELVAVGVEDEAVAAVTGYGPDVLWRDIMAACVRIRDGLPWVASNTDHTIPTPMGVAPGHGVLVDMVQRFTGVTPTVAGKPERPLLDTTTDRCGATRALMVGDRIDTDIVGGRAVGVPTLLVMTGVTGAAELAACPPEERPTYVAADLGGLLEPQPEVEPGATDGDVTGRSAAGGWTAEVRDGRLGVDGDGSASDWWRAVAVASWQHLDATGSAADTTAVHSPVAPSAPGTADR